MILGKNINHEIRFDFRIFPRPSWQQMPKIYYPEDKIYGSVQLQVWLSINGRIEQEIHHYSSDDFF